MTVLISFFLIFKLFSKIIRFKIYFINFVKKINKLRRNTFIYICIYAFVGTIHRNLETVIRQSEEVHYININGLHVSPSIRILPRHHSPPLLCLHFRTFFLHACICVFIYIYICWLFSSMEKSWLRPPTEIWTMSRSNKTSPKLIVCMS